MRKQKVGIVGLGAAGSFAMRSLASRGLDVTGFEQFGFGHDFGASGNDTRQFRALYGEGAFYVEMLLQAREMWGALERETGSSLLNQCGALAVGEPDSDWIRSLIACGDNGNIPYEVIEASDIARRFPQLRGVQPGDVAVLDKFGGIVRSNESVLWAIRTAQERGATALSNTEVLSIDEQSDAVLVNTSQGRFKFDQVIVSTGPWASEFLPWSAVAIRPSQMTYHYSLDGMHAAEKLPPVMMMRNSTRVLATQPMPDGHLVKLFTDNSYKMSEQPADSLRALRAGIYKVPYEFYEAASALIEKYVSGVSRHVVRAVRAFEGYTPDKFPLIGRSRPDSRVLVTVGWSGHGMKLAPAYSELLADIVMEKDNPKGKHFSPLRFPGGSS